MIQSLTVAAVAALLLATAAVSPAAAAPFQLLPAPATTETGLQLASVGYCRAWRIECRERWGLGSWRYRRCLRVRGC